MSKREFKDLTDAEFQRILRLIDETRQLKDINQVRSEFISVLVEEMYGGDKTKAMKPKSLAQNELWVSGWDRSLERFIREQERAIAKTVLAFCENVLELEVQEPQTVQPMNEAFEDVSPHWAALGKNLACPHFFEKLGRGDTLTYLLFRSKGDAPSQTGKDRYKNGCTVSRMVIKYDPIRDALPTFTTSRDAMFEEKTYEGVFCRVGTRNYSIGRISSPEGLRYARIFPMLNQNGWYDLIGLRLGEFQGSPLAHRVCAYQIQTTPEKAVKKLLKIQSFADERFTDNVDDAGQKLILDAVCSDGLEEGGLLLREPSA